MLKSVIRTDKETKEYLKLLRRRLKEQRKAPVEGMAEFFAARINEYESVHLGNFPEIYEHAADFLDAGINSLLDIGCGTGLELKYVFRRFPGLAVTGVDMSAEMLDKLRGNYPDKDVRLIKDDYFRYPFDDELYDAVISVETLHHFTYEDKIRIFEKIYRAVKPGGSYLQCDYIACCDEEERLCRVEYEYRRKKSRVAGGALVHIDIPLTLRRETELLFKAGFTRVETLYIREGTVILKACKES
jgi:methyltransferase type 11